MNNGLLEHEMVWKKVEWNIDPHIPLNLSHTLLQFSSNKTKALSLSLSHNTTFLGQYLISLPQKQDNLDGSTTKP